MSHFNLGRTRSYGFEQPCRRDRTAGQLQIVSLYAVKSNRNMHGRSKACPFQRTRGFDIRLVTGSIRSREAACIVRRYRYLADEKEALLALVVRCYNDERSQSAIGDLAPVECYQGSPRIRHGAMKNKAEGRPTPQEEKPGVEAENDPVRAR